MRDYKIKDLPIKRPKVIRSKKVHENLIEFTNFYEEVLSKHPLFLMQVKDKKDINQFQDFKIDLGRAYEVIE